MFFYCKSVWFCRKKSEHGWWNKRIQTREALGVTSGDPHHKIKATVMLLETRNNICCQRSTLVTDLQHLKHAIYIYWVLTVRLSALILLKNLIVSNNVYWQRRRYQRGPRERQLLLDGGESSPDEVQTGLRHTSSRRQWATKISPYGTEKHLASLIWPHLAYRLNVQCHCL